MHTATYLGRSGAFSTRKFSVLCACILRLFRQYFKCMLVCTRLSKGMLHQKISCLESTRGALVCLCVTSESTHLDAIALRLQHANGQATPI